MNDLQRIIEILDNLGIASLIGDFLVIVWVTIIGAMILARLDKGERR